MTRAGPTISADRFDAVLFDLDGVLTDTAKVHAASWKTMFDEYLHLRAQREGVPFVPFDVEGDYLRHVDGKPRISGVRDFLRSRGIELPEGAPDDPPGSETVRGLGNRKNKLFNEILTSGGVDPYPDAVDAVKRILGLGVRTAVVSSSHNCEAVLRAAGLTELFELRVDGGVAERLQLAGKPAPDTFLAAASQLGVPAGRAVVVEDAISGVQAGRDGGFGLVIGVARGSDRQALEQNGAGLVVDTLAEVTT
jgi:beta-phosphoglucomutase family hydrolase